MEAPAYRIVFAPRAERDFRALTPEIQRRLKPRIDTLAHNPRPRGAKVLSSEEGVLRLRVGDYRIIYQVDGHTRTILILKIGHRREVSAPYPIRASIMQFSGGIPWSRRLWDRMLC